MRWIMMIAALGLIAGGPALADMHAAQDTPDSDELITGCDILASNPYDPDRVAPAVPRPDNKRAIAQCRADLADNPDHPRLMYQLGRVLYYDNPQNEETFPLFERASELGYRQAAFLLGYLATRWEDNPETGPRYCYAEKYWRQSADAGRLAAQIDYVRGYVKGWWADCEDTADMETLQGYLDAAAVHETPKGYYGMVMVDELRAALAMGENAQGAWPKSTGSAAEPD